MLRWGGCSVRALRYCAYFKFKCLYLNFKSSMLIHKSCVTCRKPSGISVFVIIVTVSILSCARPCLLSDGLDLGDGLITRFPRDSDSRAYWYGLWGQVRSTSNMCTRRSYVYVTLRTTLRNVKKYTNTSLRSCPSLCLDVFLLCLDFLVDLFPWFSLWLGNFVLFLVSQFYIYNLNLLSENYL